MSGEQNRASVWSSGQPNAADEQPPQHSTVINEDAVSNAVGLEGQFYLVFLADLCSPD